MPAWLPQSSAKSTAQARKEMLGGDGLFLRAD
jgi:hypothetical protein